MRSISVADALARLGYCSKEDAIRLIHYGRVFVMNWPVFDPDESMMDECAIGFWEDDAGIHIGYESDEPLLNKTEVTP